MLGVLWFIATCVFLVVGIKQERRKKKQEKLEKQYKQYKYWRYRK